MPIFSLSQAGFRSSVRSSRGPANFGASFVLDASTIPVPPEMMARWQAAWNATYAQAVANFQKKFSGSPVEGHYPYVIYTEMPLVGDYYSLEQDRSLSAKEALALDPGTVSSVGSVISGTWNEFAAKMIGLYQSWQQQKNNDAVGTQNNTIVAQATRIGGQANLEILAKILSGYARYLTADDLQFLNFMYADWQTPKSDSDIARLSQLMQMLASKGFSYSASSAVQDKMTQIQQTLGPGADQAAAIYQSYKDELATNGTIDSIKQAFMASYEAIQNQVSNMKVAMANTTDQGQVVSNGSSVALTAQDWSGAQANQQAVTAVNDATRVSPLETAFLTASKDIQSDVALVQQQTQKNPNLALYAIFGFLAYKLFRR